MGFWFVLEYERGGGGGRRPDWESSESCKVAKVSSRPGLVCAAVLYVHTCSYVRVVLPVAGRPPTGTVCSRSRPVARSRHLRSYNCTGMLIHTVDI